MDILGVKIVDNAVFYIVAGLAFLLTTGEPDLIDKTMAYMDAKTAAEQSCNPANTNPISNVIIVPTPVQPKIITNTVPLD